MSRQGPRSNEVDLIHIYVVLYFPEQLACMSRFYAVAILIQRLIPPSSNSLQRDFRLV